VLTTDTETPVMTETYVVSSNREVREEIIMSGMGMESNCG